MKTMIRKHTAPLVTAASLLSFSLAAVFASVTLAEDTAIYKSIAEDGSTVFTDQPAPDATIIKPPPLNMMDGLPDKPANPTVQTSEEPPPILIDQIIIDHPTDQQTFNDPEGPIWVEFKTSPAESLPTELSANVRVDGVLVVTGNRQRMPIDVPPRGAHQVQVQLVDQSGTIIAESDLVEIFIKQHVAGSAN